LLLSDIVDIARLVPKSCRTTWLTTRSLVGKTVILLATHALLIC